MPEADDFEEEDFAALDSFSPAEDDAASGIDSTATGRPIFPFRNEEQVRRSFNQFAQRNTKLGQKEQLLNRLDASGLLAGAAIPLLIGCFDRQEMAIRHRVLESFDCLLGQGGELSAVADDLTRYVSDPNYGLRVRVAELLQKMKAQALPGLARLMGCARHPNRDIRLLALAVLQGIGPIAGHATVERLQKMLATTPLQDEELRNSLGAALKAMRLGGEEEAVGDAGTVRPFERVVPLINALGSVRVEDTEHCEVARKLDALDLETRREGLILSLQAGNPRIRGAAARYMAIHYEEYFDQAKVILRAYQRDTDLRSRGDIADLLTVIFCALTLPKEVPPAD